MTKTKPQELDLLAVGETLVDLISDDEAESLAEAELFRKVQGGSPANLAVNFSRLGGRSAIVSKVGRDGFGKFLESRLRAAGVCTDYLQYDPSARTSLVLVARSKGTPEFEALRDADFRLKAEEILPEALIRTRIVHTSAFALSLEPCRAAVLHACRVGRATGKIVSLDPNYSPLIWPDREEARRVLSEVLALCEITKPSLDDAARLWGGGQTPQDYIRRFHDLGPQRVVLTMGAEGTLISDGRALTHIPLRPIEVVDITGAGDAFWAGFLIAMLDGLSLEHCGLFAREIVERKLKTVGPLAGSLDRHAIYSALEK